MNCKQLNSQSMFLPHFRIIHHCFLFAVKNFKVLVGILAKYLQILNINVTIVLDFKKLIPSQTN